MEKIITLSDKCCIEDRLIFNERTKGGPKGTRIIIRNADTKEVLDTVENKITITGGVKGACDAFGIEPPVKIPTYNTELGLENTVDEGTEPKNRPIVCLFCVGDSGCGANEDDVFVARYTDRIGIIDDIIPFRYETESTDLNANLRKRYFGRKIMPDGRIAYYFKSFETEPQMHLRYTDGTQITDQLYNVVSTQPAECYVETRVKVSRGDCRDYIEQVLGWEKARISTLSLCYAWYDDTIDDYLWYQDIYPYSKLNFSLKRLNDLTLSLEFIYQVFY